MSARARSSAMRGLVASYQLKNRLGPCGSFTIRPLTRYLVRSSERWRHSRSNSSIPLTSAPDLGRAVVGDPRLARGGAALGAGLGAARLRAARLRAAAAAPAAAEPAA